MLVEEIFKIDRNDELVKIALTHPSFTKENGYSDLENYERLEFFGDSVLKLFTSKLLYETYPNAPEGELSKIRSILVSDAILAQIATKIELDKLMIIGPAEEKQGGRKRESNIACTLEAILGASYFKGKQNEIEAFIKEYVMAFAEDVDKHFEKYNAKDILQQYTQGINKTLPIYKTIGIKGPAHKPIFEVQVEWDGRIIAKASGKSKKEAQQNCALEACKKLGAIK